MADISAIKLPNNNTYNINDSRIEATDITNWNSKAAGDHTHGDLTNAGDITTSATIASGDRLVINDESASKITNSSITFGNSTTTFLANNGTWQTPQESGFDALNVYIEFDSTNQEISSVSETYDDIVTAYSSSKPIVAFLKNYNGAEVLQAYSCEFEIPDNICYFYFDRNYIKITVEIYGGDPDSYSWSESTILANRVYAGPSSGGSGRPTFRSLVAADIPSLPASIIGSGQLPVANGGTGAASLDAAGIITKTGSQTITGAKYFDSLYAENGSAENIILINNIPAISLKNVDENVLGSIELNTEETNDVFRTKNFVFKQNSYDATGTLNYIEIYALPVVEAGLAENKTYEILTTKPNSLTTTQAADARSNLGIGNVGTLSYGSDTSTFLRNDGTWATPTGGSGGGDVTTTTNQTISGYKYFNQPSVYAPNGSGSIWFYRASSDGSGSGNTAVIIANTQTVNNLQVMKNMIFRQNSYNSSTGATRSNFENYVLPDVDGDLTSNKTYEIMTEKNIGDWMAANYPDADSSTY